MGAGKQKVREREKGREIGVSVRQHIYREVLPGSKGGGGGLKAH